MRRTGILNNYFSSEDENIEMYACFPWCRIKGINSSKENGKKYKEPQPVQFK